MGSSSSKKSAGHPRKVTNPDHGPLPLETVPYSGPLVQYRIVELNVNFTPHIQFNFMTPGASQMTTNVDDYYPTLGANYGDGFVLVTFYKIPGGMQRQGFLSMNMSVPFQGIFIRYPSVPTEERWQLRIEKSVMFVQSMASMRIFSGSASQSSANTSHLIDMIANCTSAGGRLVCVELTGTQSSQAMHMGFTGAAATSGLGVDLFFNMPLHPNPKLYTYQCVSTPIPMTMQAGLGQVNIDIQFNFMAQLGAYLNQGFRLVEVFYDCSSVMQTQGMIAPTAGMSMNSIWFFEKEASRVNDNTPVYEGCIVEYYLKIQANFSGTVSRANWAPLLEVMGTKGWELACTLETPKMVRSGMMTFKQTVLLFFQRPMSHPAAGTPLGMVDPATGEPLGPQATQQAPPSYDSVVGK